MEGNKGASGDRGAAPGGGGEREKAILPKNIDMLKANAEGEGGLNSRHRGEKKALRGGLRGVKTARGRSVAKRIKRRINVAGGGRRRRKKGRTGKRGPKG